ncbi:HAMP domain-containing histidine kinase [Campylobacter corcagiensis]|uniref:histidine kinase n=1 Tax=Campylobacter corcagiensis TaxID=1448857 RepID=A0A7M1LHQ5_9BACT|nr:HAMP domain-containing histidine kinase [Campylobacter corcagiensis]
MVVFYVTKLTYKSVTLPFLEKNQMLNTFFNDAMHELKTPLGVASINLEMLEFRDKHTHRIKGALRQMKVAYEDVEYFIKNERVNFPKEIINFSEFLRDRIRFSSTIANVKKISIEEFIADGLEIYMSKVEATRLVDNNLSNALKYSHPNSIIKVELVKDKNSASFSVEDFGIGIKDSAKIWSRFQKEDTTRGGFGLGLNIVLKICQKYAINYSVDSVYQKGSKFTYKIPLYKELLLDNIG